MLIRFLCHTDGHRYGTVVDHPDERAAYLVEHGWAEAVEDRRKVKG